MEEDKIRNHEKRFSDIEIVITAREWFETQSLDLPNPMRLLSSEELEEIHWHYPSIWIKNYRCQADTMIARYITEIEHPSLDSISVAIKLDSIIVRSESHPTIVASFCLIKFEEARENYGIQEERKAQQLRQFVYERKMETQKIMAEHGLSRKEAIFYEIRNINEQLALKKAEEVFQQLKDRSDEKDEYINFLKDETAYVMKIRDGDPRFGRSAIDLKTKIKASAILDQIVPARNAFILINEDDQACLASPLPCWGDDDDGVKGSFCKHILSLIDLHDMKDKNGEGILKSPLFYKSSELKNIKSMDESDYYKQSELKEVIDDAECNFVDIDDICNQVIKETNMKHVILILDFCRQEVDGSFLITSNTMEEEDAIAITKAKLNNPYYTRTPSVTEESEELYKKFGNHIFEIPKREYQLSQSTILQHQYDLSDGDMFILMNISFKLKEEIENKCTNETDKATFQNIKDMRKRKDVNILQYIHLLKFFLDSFINGIYDEELVDRVKNRGK